MSSIPIQPLSAGDCSVCAGAGHAVFARCIDTGHLFFVCPSCGCAWAEPPVAFEVDEITSPDSLARRGWVLATAQEVHSNERGHQVAEILEADSAKLFESLPGFVISEEAKQG